MYAVAFEHGSNQFSIRLTGEPAQGKIDAFSYGRHLAGDRVTTAQHVADDTPQGRP